MYGLGRRGCEFTILCAVFAPLEHSQNASHYNFTLLASFPLLFSVWRTVLLNIAIAHSPTSYTSPCLNITLSD